jgi:hypothetical protein
MPAFRRSVAVLLVAALALVIAPALGGCAHRMAVDGRSDQLYAEAKGALESEGFRPLTKGSHYAGAKGSSKAEGRLQFLYYADNIVPTVVEINIEPGPDAVLVGAPEERPAAGVVRGQEGAKTGEGGVKGDGAGGRVAKGGSGGTSADVVSGASGTNGAQAAKSCVPALNGPHSVAISAWSSLTYSPDPWIADLAVGVLRRAYLISGNVR